jgi:ParB/RepB/Spo0J family partition protein
MTTHDDDNEARQQKLPIAAIKIGKRHRRDMGDVSGLAQSLQEVGLLHPIVVRPDGILIAGERRLHACKMLGLTEVPIRVVNIDEIARGEFAENAYRKDFLPSEIDAIRRELEPIEKAPAKERMTLGKVSLGSGKTSDKIGAFAGISGRTVEKIAAVVDAAEQAAEKYGRLLTDMDRTGRVNGVYKMLKNAQKAEAIRLEPSPLPGNGPYRVIVADPPWATEKRSADPSHRMTVPYPGMCVADICAMPVASIAHDDCILWLWTTNANMRDAFAVIDAWGFELKTILTWVKQKMGLGDWLRGQTEHCLLAVRGKPTVKLTNQTTALIAPATEHSRKPEEFYKLVETLCPAPRYCELFARQQRDGWDGHGDEIR